MFDICIADGNTGVLHGSASRVTIQEPTYCNTVYPMDYKHRYGWAFT